jgi:hypothetical protein
MRNNLSETKNVTAIRPISLASATSTSVIIDTKGYSLAKFLIQFGAVAGDITSITVQSSEASDFGSGVVDRLEADAAGITVAEAGAADLGLDADIRNWERYVRIVVVKASSAAVLSATVILGNAHESPITATARGYSAALVAA